MRQILHFCLAVLNPEDVNEWDEHLQKQGSGSWDAWTGREAGRSVYFEDLDGHVGEVGSRGIWAYYAME